MLFVKCTQENWNTINILGEKITLSTPVKDSHYLALNEVETKYGPCYILEEFGKTKWSTKGFIVENDIVDELIKTIL